MRHMGKKSAEEVMEKFDQYINKMYWMTADKLRSICFPQEK